MKTYGFRWSVIFCCVFLPLEGYLNFLKNEYPVIIIGQGSLKTEWGSLRCWLEPGRTVWNGVFSGEIPRDIWCARQSFLMAAAAAFFELRPRGIFIRHQILTLRRQSEIDQGLTLHHFNNVFIWSCCASAADLFILLSFSYIKISQFTQVPIDDFFFQRNNAVEKTRLFLPRTHSRKSFVAWNMGSR